MSGSRNITFAAAAAALIFAWGTVPCLAEGVGCAANQSVAEDANAKAPAIQEAVSKDVVSTDVVSNDVVSNDEEIVVAASEARYRPPPADFFLMPSQLPERPRARVASVVMVQPPPPPRVVAEVPPSRSCFWCGRQPVLMLGVGY